MDKINNNKEKRYLIATYGCQMNEHDSEKISWILEGMDYIPTNNKEDCDLIIYNTCAIRQTAEDKVYGQLGALKQLKRKNPDLIIGVCGCMMQIEKAREIINSKYKHVDIIFGTNNIHKLPQLINSYKQTGETTIDIVEDTREVDESIDANRVYKHKAYVNIMYGCNNYCSYCIVPYTRGREQSRDPKDIIKEIRDLASSGYKEITLLGQNVNSYGKTLDINYSFVNLLEEINEISGIERIRFMTSHPKDISDDLIEAYGRLEKLCNHLHLPVQSGSNKILRIMNRSYNKEEYLEKVRKIRKVSPNIAITTDIIVGFPGENEKDFQDTLDLVKEVEFDSAYTFLYSMRDGTPASKMKNQVEDKIKHDRFQRLLDTLNEIGLKKNQNLINKNIKVLIEDISKNNTNILNGRTECGKLVHLRGDRNLIGEIVNVKINNVKTFTLEGELNQLVN